MKKSTLMLGVASMALLAFVSCKKEDNKAVSFQANTTEFVVEDEDRAYLDANNSFIFEQGDLVKMFNIDYNNAANSECANFAARTTGNSVIFDAVEEMTWGKKSAFYSFFPAENVTPNLQNKNNAKFDLKPVQNYYAPNGTPSFAKDAMYSAAKVDDAVTIHQAHFNFDNVCGILRLKFYDANGRKFRKIIVEDPFFALSGKVGLNIDKVTKDGLLELCNAYDPENHEASVQAINEFKHTFGYSIEHTVAEEVSPYNTITLDLGENGLALATTKADASVFYFVLRPLALSHGYRVIGVDMDGNKYEFINSTSNKKIVPNTIKAIVAVDVTNKPMVD